MLSNNNLIIFLVYGGMEQYNIIKNDKTNLKKKFHVINFIYSSEELKEISFDSMFINSHKSNNHDIKCYTTPMLKFSINGNHKKYKICK